jgi:hypothetical protein
MTARHGFIDESVRSDGWYRLTMVDVAARDLGSVTRALRAMVPKGRQRLHFSSEGESQRRQILNGMMRLPITALTVAAPYQRGRDEEPARGRCIEALIAGLDPAIVLLVLDSRGAHRDLTDRRVIRGSLLRLAREDGPSYSHRGSSDEPLLALPDALGWSVGAGGYFTRTVAGRVRQVFLGDEVG